MNRQSIFKYTIPNIRISLFNVSFLHSSFNFYEILQCCSNYVDLGDVMFQNIKIVDYCKRNIIKSLTSITIQEH